MRVPQRETKRSPPEAEARLEELGLSLDLLAQCLERGQYAGDETTSNHPRVARGQYVWLETNRELRDALVPKGWTKDETDNIPKTIAPDGSYCIVAVSGNEGTGIPTGNPGTRNPRGTAGVAVVQENQQLELFPELVSEPDLELMKTWFLLYDRRDDVLYAELLLPTQVDPSGSISDWNERILLPSVDLRPGANGRLEADSDSHEEVDVPVERRDA